jgi:hypothetical protein
MFPSRKLHKFTKHKDRLMFCCKKQIKRSIMRRTWKLRGGCMTVTVTPRTSGNRASINNGGKTHFPCAQRPDRLCDPHSFLFNGYRGLKGPGRESDHSPPSSAKDKNS